jgi:hypothetical protein
MAENNDRGAADSASATEENNQQGSTSTVSGGPTDTFRKMIEASKAKDIEGVKKVFSKGTIATMEKVAQSQHTTLDEVLMSDLEKPDRDNTMPETRNEKIDGENATLDVRDAKSGQWGTFYFVREDGEWKLALDRMMENARKQLNDAMKDSTGK